MSVAVVSILGLLVVGFIGLLVVILLVVLAAKAIGGKKGSGGGLAVVALALALVLLFVFVSFFTARVSYVEQTNRDFGGEPTLEVFSNGERHANYEDPSITSSIVSAEGQTSASVTVAGNPWTDAVEAFQDFEADVYPSLEAAAEALGRRVGARLMNAVLVDENMPTMYVSYDGASQLNKQGSRNVLEAVASGIRQKIDDPSRVTIDSTVLADAVHVNLAVQEIQFENHNRWRMHTESRSGAIALRVQMPGESFSVSTRFADAPWVEARTSFASNYANGDWLVGYSDGTHTSQDEARQDAIMAASDALLPLAQARINRLSASDQHRFAQQMQKDPDWLRNKVADELVSRNLATDRFAQRFDRPYGTVWREAVLVDASQNRVEEIARSLVQGLDSKISHDRATWFSFAAMLALVFGTYLFLNFATKGYYAWTLRTVTAVGLAIVVLVILNYA